MLISKRKKEIKKDNISSKDIYYNKFFYPP